MSTTDFTESDHPRGSSGRFTTKNHAEVDVDLGVEGGAPDTEEHPDTPDAPVLVPRAMADYEQYKLSYSDPYPEAEPDEVVFYDECPRCAGDGYLEGYRGVQNGVCFKCGGHPEEFHAPVTAAKARTRERARISRENSRVRKIYAARARGEQALEALIDEDPAWGHLPVLAQDNAFLGSLNARLMTEQHGKHLGVPELSQKQKDAGLQAIHRHFTEMAERVREADEMAQLPPLTGRAQVKGKVVFTKWYDNAYGSVKKMLVKLDSGHQVFGTVPSGADVDEDQEIEFTGTFEPDYLGRPGRAGFKRPRMAKTEHKERA